MGPINSPEHPSVQDLTKIGFERLVRYQASQSLREIRKLRDLCAAIYQVCGVLNASVKVLDALSAASTGDYDGNPLDLLPYNSLNPVPTTDGLPGAEDCDSNGYCWGGNEAIAGSSHPVFPCSCWKYSARVGDGSHWLPYYALPVVPARPKL